MPLKVESVLFSYWVVLFCHISLVVPVFPVLYGHQSTNQETVTNDVFWAIGALLPQHMAIPTWSQYQSWRLWRFFFFNHPTTKKPWDDSSCYSGPSVPRVPSQQKITNPNNSPFKLTTSFLFRSSVVNPKLLPRKPRHHPRLGHAWVTGAFSVKATSPARRWDHLQKRWAAWQSSNHHAEASWETW